MTDADHVKLLSGPYKPPRLPVGSRTECLYRDAEVVISGWSDAPIPWPLCSRRAGRHAGGKGLLVEVELARAVRQESAAAVQHWWGVSQSTVCKWRRAVGAGRKNNPGSQRLIRAAVLKASASREIMQRKGSPAAARGSARGASPSPSTAAGRRG
jgi:hypothetical protein